jgi:hypothetical protein
VSPYVRYLGIFIDRKLSWSHHTDLIATRVRSTVVALGVLGNSIRGISFANWRRVFHSIIFPILTYGAPLWYTGLAQKAITNPLQVAQNAAIRKMCGVFHTTPVVPLHHVANILPITYSLRLLSDRFKIRLQRLPPNTAIRTILGSNPVVTWDIERPIPSTLRTLLSSPLPPSPYIAPSPPYRQFWSHPRVLNHLSSDLNTALGSNITLLGRCPPLDSLSLYVYPLPHPDFPSSGFLLYRGHVLVASGARGGRRLVEVLFQSLTDGLGACLTQTPLPLYVFLPFQLAHAPIFLLRKHALLPISSTFTSQLDELLSDHNHLARFYRFATPRPKKTQRRRSQPAFSGRWLGQSGKDTHLQRLLDTIQDPHLPDPAPTPKSAAYTSWAADFNPSADSPGWAACLPSEGPSFLPPFIRGVLQVASRRYLCTCIQLLFRHAFIAEYSTRFRLNAGDNTDCPCGAWSTRPGGVSIPQPLTLPHGLLRCTDTSRAREDHLHTNNIHTIFSTEAGGQALCAFVHASQAFLRPLPPHPDPP